MILTILTLLGGGLGALLRFVPELLKIWTAKADRAHELEMVRIQLEVDKARAGLAIDQTYAQGEVTEALAQMNAYTEAIKAQARPSGVRWIDGLNASVRPVITYWWMLLFSFYKICIICQAWTMTTTIFEFAMSIWTPQDAGILAMIIGFFFVNRTYLNKERNHS